MDNFARNSPSLNSFSTGGVPYAPQEGVANGATGPSLAALNTAYNANFFSGGNLASLPAGATGPVYNSINSNVKNPKYVEWNLEIQQAFGNKTSFSLNYVGNRGY